MQEKRQIFGPGVSETSECPVPGYDRNITESFQHLKTIGSILLALSGPISILPERSLFFGRGGGGGGEEEHWLMSSAAAGNRAYTTKSVRPLVLDGKLQRFLNN